MHVMQHAAIGAPRLTKAETFNLDWLDLLVRPGAREYLTSRVRTSIFRGVQGV